jgi:hypothetical protein
MRTPLAELPPLVRELVEIGRTGSFIQSDGRCDERTVEIGKQLYSSGGRDAMLYAHEEVSYWLPREARALEFAWDGIGGWQH